MAQNVNYELIDQKSKDLFGRVNNKFFVENENRPFRAVFSLFCFIEKVWYNITVVLWREFWPKINIFR